MRKRKRECFTGCFSDERRCGSVCGTANSAAEAERPDKLLACPSRPLLHHHHSAEGQRREEKRREERRGAGKGGKREKGRGAERGQLAFLVLKGSIKSHFSREMGK